MGRKNLLADLIGGQAEQPESQVAPDTEKERAPTLGSRGAVGAMSRSLEQLSADRNAAKAISEQLANGETVVKIEPGLIDESIVPDRMKGFDDSHNELVASVRAEGQLVPVLLRPHPSTPGRFQIAYGHRRVRALTEIGTPVRAVVRKLTDDELVVAQGKENGERRDLSFIERACYAALLEDRQFSRETIMSALSVDKTELSRLISVVRSVPRFLIDAIGPAPKIGRPRWLELVDRLASAGEGPHLKSLVESDQFKTAASNDRFSLVLGAVTVRSANPSTPTFWTAADGKKIAKVGRSTSKTVLELDEKVAPAFGDFVLGKLPELYAAFRQSKEHS